MSEFEDHVVKAYLGAWEKLTINHREITLRHVNESVFRYFFIQELLLQYVEFSIEDEWRRIDLLLVAPNCQAAVEFKFYDKRPRHVLDQIALPRHKGGAGRKNFQEFHNSLRGLTELEELDWYQKDKANITDRYFVLVGTKWPKLGRTGDFLNDYYPPEKVAMPTGITMKRLEATCQTIGGMEVFGWICSVTKK